ncbi:hypothetical protein ACLOJK_041143, partial [Asimina triloba]
VCYDLLPRCRQPLSGQSGSINVFASPSSSSSSDPTAMAATSPPSQTISGESVADWRWVSSDITVVFSNGEIWHRLLHHCCCRSSLTPMDVAAVADQTQMGFSPFDLGKRKKIVVVVIGDEAAAAGVEMDADNMLIADRFLPLPLRIDVDRRSDVDVVAGEDGFDATRDELCCCRSVPLLLSRP